MNPCRCTQGFTLVELLVAVAITLALAGVMLSVTTGTLNVWRHAQDNFSTSTEAKLALDFLERDLQSALFRRDGQTWLAVDVTNTASSLTNHGWLVESGMKPATAESQIMVPPADGTTAPTIADARFGLSGAWLRFITTNVESGGSLPVAVSYQIARRPLTGTNVSSSNPAEIRYTLFRSAVESDTTFANGYDVLAAGYGSNQQNPTSTRSPSTLTNPNNADAIATNVVDFAVWLYVRDSTGGLQRIFPGDAGDLAHAANDTGAAPTSSQFPQVADVMVRILTEEGAKQIAAIEQGNGAIIRPSNYATAAAWWWAVVEANSRVAIRRVEIRGAAL